MREDISIRITGEAGRGIVSSGMMLCRMYKDSCRHVLAIQDYMSRIRGGNNFIQVRAAVKPVAAPRQLADIILSLDKEAARRNRLPIGVLYSEPGPSYKELSGLDALPPLADADITGIDISAALADFK